MGSKLYKKIIEELTEAIQWTGKNVDEIKEFVPKKYLEVIIDRVTQFTNFRITNYDLQERYESEWGDYIVKLGEDSYKIVSRKEFEREFIDVDKSAEKKAIEDSKIYVKLEFVRAVEFENGEYLVTDNTGFVKRVPKEQFENEYKLVDNFLTKE